MRVGERVQHPHVGQRVGAAQHRVERALRGPPSRRRCRPSRPPAATGSTTSARSVTARRAQLEADHERRGVERGQRRGRVGQVVRVDAADHAARGRSPVVHGGEDRGRCRGRRRSGSRSTPHAAATSTRAAASATGRPPGSSAGSAPASTAPRSPARRGTQASRAPVASASRTHGGQRAGDGGQPLADQDDRAVAGERGGGLGLTRASPRAQRVEHLGLGAGRGRQQRAGQLLQPAGRAAARPRGPSAPPLAHRLAQPQEDDRRLLLGLEADEQHGRRRSRSA